MVSKVYLEDVFVNKDMLHRVVHIGYELSDGVMVAAKITEDALQNKERFHISLLELYMVAFNSSAKGRYKMFSNKEYITKYET